LKKPLDTVEQLALASGLSRVGGRPPLGSYLKQAWVRRDFVSMMAIYRLRSTMEENRLGILWYIIRPVFDAAIYGFVFGILQGASRGPDFPAYVVTGVFLFRFFSGSFGSGAQSVISSRDLVQSLAFPRVTLPLSRVVEEFIAILPPMALLPFFLMLLGHMPSLRWLMMIPLLAIFAILNAGVAMIMARLTVHLRDMVQMVPVIGRLLFYSSSVFFRVGKIFANHPSVMRAFDFHPLYAVLRIARGLMLGTPETIQPGAEYYFPSNYWLTLSIWAVVLFVFGIIFFWRAEERYGRE